ncbi:ZIP family metal transporter [Candidatus Woesearchaeota archaeon]|nr:ZIP family metal transporter [Candidatus Woesearchaeota archaeon]
MILFSVSIVSLVSILAVFFLKVGSQRLFWIISFAAGTMLGAAFLDMLPEAVEVSGGSVLVYSLAGIAGFFILEHFIHWHHHRHESKSLKSAVYPILVGDAIHNFVDGTVIAASFLTDVRVGIAATAAIIFHEVPQELGDAGILIYSGLSRFKAAVFNFASAITAFVGALLAFYFNARFEWLNVILVSFAAGGFIYIAAGDLLPELRKELDVKKSGVHIMLFLSGIMAIWLIIRVVGAV